MSNDNEIDYFGLNAMLNLFDEDGKLQLEKDKQAVRQYFLENVNRNTVFFHNLAEKLAYLVDNGYYEKEVFDLYSDQFVHDVFDYAYSFKYRFTNFVGAYKFFTSYALKTFDGKRFLERFEDRVADTSLPHQHLRMLGRSNVGNWYHASFFELKTIWKLSVEQ
jgi:ribonucleoside-diphosphate reductase alpha chain